MVELEKSWFQEIIEIPKYVFQNLGWFMILSFKVTALTFASMSLLCLLIWIIKLLVGLW